MIPFKYPIKWEVHSKFLKFEVEIFHGGKEKYKIKI